jgi:hypothetical protein
MKRKIDSYLPVQLFCKHVKNLRALSSVICSHQSRERYFYFMEDTMPETTTVAYPLRRKMDGSSDLICLNCLTTLTPAKQENESAEHEHICHTFLTRRTN